jgi:predicted nuclease with TOPRIM domain
MSSRKPASASTTNGNSLNETNKLMDMVTELKNTQNKMITSVNSCRDSIKSHETKFDTLFNNLSQQLSEVTNENNSLKDKVQQLKSKLSGFESGQMNNISQEKLFSEIMDRSQEPVILFYSMFPNSRPLYLPIIKKISLLFLLTYLILLA